MSHLAELQEPEIQEKDRPGAVLEGSPVSQPLDGRFFADVLLEADHGEKRRRTWAAVSSVLFQSLLLGVALVVPLMFTDALPKQQLLTFLVAPPPPPPPPPPAAAMPTPRVVRHIDTDLMDGRLRAPSRIPQKVQMIKEEDAPPPLSAGGVIGGVPGGIPGGQLGGVIGGIVSSTSALKVIPKLVPVIPKRVRVSQGVTVGLLIHRVEPKYPPLARQARIQGDVVLTAIISKEGLIQNLQVESGHPMLIAAALSAVQQWRYRPFLVSGEPVEVETTVTVSFRFSQ
jgi:periplasmic protein TonB